MDFSKVCILDGYIDEPSLLGVPPYISPYPRYIYGAVKDTQDDDADVIYMTIDQYRSDPQARAKLKEASFIIIIAGCLVPGKYLSAKPVSIRELDEITGSMADIGKKVFLAGGFAIYRFDKLAQKGNIIRAATGDVDATLFDMISGNDAKERGHTPQELARWSVEGAQVVKQHPYYPDRLICEIETYRGCVRYSSGGCAFCMEPDHGRPEFRPIAEIIDEVGALYNAGVRNFRVGGQSCIFSYGTEELGKTPTPKPNPKALEELFGGIRERCPDIKVLHVDNANPAVIAEHPKESREIAEILVEYCTPGNVIAFGLESADPAVYEAANLNATVEQTLEAVRLMNEVGGERGENGMPKLLPGINFLFGLPGETKRTYELDQEFLETVLDEGLLVRRTNIRQVARTVDGEPFVKVDRKRFKKFKRWAREEFDRTQLERMLPRGTILTGIQVEKHDGNVSFGRQTGSYPLLVGFDFKLPDERFDGMVVDYGSRSITCVRHPLPVNQAKLRELRAVPGIGKKRAANLVRNRPYQNYDELMRKVPLDEDVFDYKGLFIFV
jgi:radical SAM superfamily enzyme with C-terminal helix-hairpin-helix motif